MPPLILRAASAPSCSCQPLLAAGCWLLLLLAQPAGAAASPPPPLLAPRPRPPRPSPPAVPHWGSCVWLPWDTASAMPCSSSSSSSSSLPSWLTELEGQARVQIAEIERSDPSCAGATLDRDEETEPDVDSCARGSGDGSDGTCAVSPQGGGAAVLPPRGGRGQQRGKRKRQRQRHRRRGRSAVTVAELPMATAAAAAVTTAARSPASATSPLPSRAGPRSMPSARPYEVNDVDHCETPAEAYADIAPVSPYVGPFSLLALGWASPWEKTWLDKTRACGSAAYAFPGAPRQADQRAAAALRPVRRTHPDIHIAAAPPAPPIQRCLSNGRWPPPCCPAQRLLAVERALPGAGVAVTADPTTKPLPLFLQLSTVPLTQRRAA
jgi:hypothetical protein